MKKGFTFIEVLIVIALIGIITSVFLVLLQADRDSKMSEPEYCQKKGIEEIRFLPAKCIKYFLNPDERKIYESVVK